jgi:hypothetical protein
MMEAIGLMPSSTGAPGGKRIGDRVSHWIVPDGPLTSPARLSWPSRRGCSGAIARSNQERRPAQQVFPSGRRQGCMGAAGRRLYCGEHAGGDSVRMLEITPTPASARALTRLNMDLLLGAALVQPARRVKPEVT